MRKTVIIVLVMITWLLFADGTYPEGSGTADDPFLIENLDNLLWLSTVNDYWYPGIHYLQTSDINAGETRFWNGGYGFDPIGSYNSEFEANYDGGGYRIDSLYIDRPDMISTGLFSYIAYNEVNDLELSNVFVCGSDRTGVLAGRGNHTILSNVRVTGEVHGHTDTGLLCGYSEFMEISNCSTNGYVHGNDKMGGFSGRIIYTQITNSFSEVSIAGIHTAGGMSGFCYDVEMDSCWVISQISCDHTAGGLVGHLKRTEINNSYAEFMIESSENNGGLAGIVDIIEISNSYYNYQNSLFNSEPVITIGAISEEMYLDWQANGLHLFIDDYLESNTNGYNINSLEDFSCLLAFGQNQDSYDLTIDIDLSGMENFYIPYFMGEINGHNHLISGFSVFLPQNNSIGLFGYISSSSISNLRLSDVQVTGGNKTGGLVGESLRPSEIDHCLVSGEIFGNDHTGGISGYGVSIEITNSKFEGSVSGDNFVGGLSADTWATFYTGNVVIGTISGTSNVGGLAGYADSQIQRCYALVDIVAEEIGGGLVGGFWGAGMYNCFARGSIEATSNSGGLIGECFDAWLYNNYASMSMNVIEGGGGLMGIWGEGDYGSINRCVWNTDEIAESTGNAVHGNFHNVIGATYEEMRLMNTYTDIGWDFAGESANGNDDYWSIDSALNNGFPYLTGMEPPVYSDNSLIKVDKIIDNLSACPNPFNPETHICFRLFKPAKHLMVKVYNIKGQVIWQKEADLPAGEHRILWRGCDQKGLEVASGIYFYQISNGNIEKTAKVLLLK